MSNVISGAVHMNSIVFTFLFLRGVGSYHKALVRPDISSHIIAGIIWETGKLHKKSQSVQGNIANLMINFFLSWL